jgi:Flp pilus assembly pilin Flp
MRALKNLGSRLIRDENGGEVMEYILIAALIVLGSIAAIASIGGKIFSTWTSASSI